MSGLTNPTSWMIAVNLALIAVTIITSLRRTKSEREKL